MLIQIIKDGEKSDWVTLTKRLHRELEQDVPDEVRIHIEDIYPQSPDQGELLSLGFSLFSILMREMTLYTNKLDKRDERHLDKRPIERIDPAENENLTYQAAEDEYFKNEEIHHVRRAQLMLTPTQYRRLSMFVDNGLSIYEIARREGVHPTSAEQTIKLACKKIKKLLK